MIQHLRELLRETTGLVLSTADVERAVRERMQAGGIRERADYAPLPASAEFEALVDLVVVPESWMLRDAAVFQEALRFVKRRMAVRPVRILSLPCAGGEEAYSMALTLLEAGIPATRCRIDAMDLSGAAIARAREGRYTRNAFRGADLSFRDRWFTRIGDEYLVDDALRAYIRFSQGNLFALPLPEPRYDLVFCRNLLIYFDDPTRIRAAEALAAVLEDDGLLLSGFAEAPAFCRNGFTPQSARTGFALRKAARVAASRPAAARRGAAGKPLASPAVPAAVPAASPPVFVPAASQPVSMPAASPPAPVRSAPLAPQVPPQAQDLLAQAQREADSGRLPEAEAACRALLARQPDQAQAWFLLGMVSESAGRPQAAIEYWRRCVYLDPDHYEALCSLALLHERLGDGAAGDGYRRRAARIYGRRGSVDA